MHTGPLSRSACSWLCQANPIQDFDGKNDATSHYLTNFYFILAFMISCPPHNSGSSLTPSCAFGMGSRVGVITTGPQGDQGNCTCRACKPASGLGPASHPTSWVRPGRRLGAAPKGRETRSLQTRAAFPTPTAQDFGKSGTGTVPRPRGTCHSSELAWTRQQTG